HNLIIVVLCDYMERKFQSRLVRSDLEDDDNDDDVVENHRTKLNAALARLCRISLNVLTLDSFLPESVRKNDKIASGMLVSAWVNAAKTSLHEVKQALHDKNFKEVSTQDELTHLTYLHDDHCPDLIFFPGQMLQKLEKISIVTKKFLVLQDKSSSVGLHALVSVLGEDDDVVYVNVGSAISAGHLASILYNRGSSVYAFGVTSKKQLKQCSMNLEKLGVRGQGYYLRKINQQIDGCFFLFNK
ncbi:hypothetical protein HELRODRAFT_84266, partial [Helobdella robusta]|uniref:SAM-dependent MTase RsmB/NOP-type domain-containing protein n=1 Tax=Helobdella robusta TaxID=6412 RepID=T1G5G7_HELRO